MCAECKCNIMLDFKVFRISIIIYMKELFNLMNPLFSKVNNLVLFINDEVSIFFNFLVHNCLHLSSLALIFTLL